MNEFDCQVDMLLILGECRKNYRSASELWAVRFPHLPRKSHMAFKRLENRSRQSGQLSSKKRNRRKTKTNEEMTVGVLGTVALNPHIGSRNLAADAGMSKTSVLRILRNYKFHPYHITLHQELNELDFERRVDFCHWFRRWITENNSLENIIFSDEATFTNHGQVNRHNMHYWAEENPHWMRTVAYQHPWSVYTWCGIFGDVVIGPHFFDGTLNGQRYCDFLRNDLPRLLPNIPERQREVIWFQQDGAPPHFCRNARTILNDTYPNRWIGRGGPVNWPARSPDLTPLDFFLWGFVKEKVMAIAPTTVEDMRQRITRAVQEITPNMLLRVRNSFRNRVNKCLEKNGHHFEHLLM